MGNFYFFSVMLLSCFLAIIANKTKKKRYVYIIIVLISFLAGFRGIGVGIDTLAYNNAFINNFPYHWQFEEQGFRLISSFIYNMFHDTRIVFFTFSIVTNFCIISRLWDFKEKCSFPFMVLFYLMTFYLDSMNIMRQMIAVSIIFYSTKLLEKKHFLIFIIIVILMTQIHSSSLLALVLVLVYYWKSLKPTQKILILVPMLVVGFFSILYILNYESVHINNYLSSSNAINNINIPFLYRVLIFIISYILLKSNKKIVFRNELKKSSTELENVEFLQLKNIIIIYFIGLMISSLGLFFVVMARLGYFYILFELLYWGYMIKSSKNKSFNLMMFSIYVVYVFLVEIFTGGCGVFPFYLNL